jgi:hypothetical protein
MPAGILIKGSIARGVEVTVAGKMLQVKRTFAAAPESVDTSKSVVGFPVSQFFIKSVLIPCAALGKKELENAVKMQTAFHLPYEESSAFVRQQVKELSRNHGILLAALPRKKLSRPCAVLPDALGLYALAFLQELLAPGKKVLLVHVDQDEVTTVAVEGHAIVFMRQFPEEDLLTELRLSTQSVYLQEERSFLEPESVVLFSEDAGGAERLTGIYAGTVTQLRPSQLLQGNIKKGTEAAFLIPAGLALCGTLLGLLHSQRKNIGSWNVFGNELHFRQRLQKGLLWSLPLWPLFLVLYLYADLHAQTSRLAGVQGRMHALSGKYQAAVDLEEELVAKEEFFKTFGPVMQSPESWFRLLDLLSKSRPSGVYLTGISGKTAGAVLVSGKAPDYPDVTDYMTKLSASGDFDNLMLVYTQGRADEEVDFQLSFRMK